MSGLLIIPKWFHKDFTQVFGNFFKKKQNKKHLK
jgi:hypothetical protein